MQQLSLMTILVLGLAAGSLVGAICVRINHAWRDLYAIRARTHRARREAWTATGSGVRLGMASMVVVAVLIAISRMH